MRFPYISKLNKQSEVIGVFGGLNCLTNAQASEFSDMKNISVRDYPAVTPRVKRGTKTAIADPKGFFIKNGTFWIDGTQAHFNNTTPFTVSNVLPKKIVGMGAYICIWPDKIMFNTSTGVKTNLESTYNQSASITFAPLSTGSAFTKITAAGIHNYFSAYDNVTISGCSNSDFNGTKVIQSTGTNFIVVTGALTSSFSQASGLSFKRSVPDLDFIIERDNRLWGCNSDNHEVYSSKLGDPKNWYNYEGLSDDAFAATIASDGDFTGIAKYSSMLIFFKEHTAHVLRGDKPANYSITEKPMAGIKAGCDKSVCTINDVLYYVGPDGVYRFAGGVPENISKKVDSTFDNAQAGTYESKLYLSAGDLYVYDPQTSIWVKEDDEELNWPQSAEGNLYYIDGDNNLTTIAGNRDEIIDWALESVSIDESSIDNKYISKVRIMVQLDIGSDIVVSAKFDGGDWVQKGYVKSTAKKTYTIPITPTRCSRWKYKLEGRGEMKLIAVSRDVEGGSDINVNIQSQWR